MIQPADLVRRIRATEEQLFLVLTLVIGAVVGLVIVAFIVITERLGHHLYPEHGHALLRLLIPVAGALVSGHLLYRFFPKARGSGIPQTKTALYAERGRISLRTVIGRFVCSSTTLASGIALGREGPSVHLGAGIASVLGRRFGLSEDKVKSLLPVGAAAALAAAFNTPIAAVLFSLEEVMGDLHAPLLGSVVLGSATSWIVLHLLLGDEPLFHVPAYHLVHPVEFINYAILGVVGGFVSVGFVQLLLWIRGQFLKFSKDTLWLQPTAGGFIVGIMGLFVPAVLGVGYLYVNDALNGRMAVGLMALLVVLKVVATASSYSSGNSGGIFGPSLFIGAMLGGAFGSLFHYVMPHFSAESGAYALVGMGAAFAGIVRVPFTSVIMIFEMTRDYTIIVPLMISNLISFYISYRFQRTPIYEALAEQVGIHLPSAHSRRHGEHLRVRNAMHAVTVRIQVSMSPADALKAVAGRDGTIWPLFEDNSFIRMISIPELERRALEKRAESLMSARRTAHFPHVHPDHTLDIALQRMGTANLKTLPVVSRSDLHKLEGIITIESVLYAYGLSNWHSQTDGKH
jgi:CIC family chloride channel protein